MKRLLFVFFTATLAALGAWAPTSCSKPVPVIVSDASDAAPKSSPHKAGFGFSQRIIFTASSTAWTAPGGVASINACGCGGGGGGGGGGGSAVGSSGGGGGGGGGALWYCDTVAVTPGTAYTVVASAGGAAGTNASGAAGGPGGIGPDSLIKITSSGNVIISFPGASGGVNGTSPGDASAFGGMPFAGGTGSAARTAIYDIGVVLSTRTATSGLPVLYPQSGGRAATTGSAPGSNGNNAFVSFITGSTTLWWTGGAGGGGGSLGGAGGGGGAGPLGTGGAGGAGTSSAVAGNPGFAPSANTCAGGGGGSGAGSGVTAAGGLGGAGGSGEVIIEY